MEGPLPGMARPELPCGIVTFLFTDIEGSTRLIEVLGEDGYVEALAEHRRLLRAAFAAHGGVEVDTQGDAFLYAFAEAAAALAAAATGQQALDRHPVTVRMGLHTGEPLLTGEGYAGRELHRAARIAASGHGGQVVVSSTTRSFIDGDLTALGEHRLKDFAEPVALFQLGDGRFPPLKTISNTNLPRPASSFIGRAEEREQLLSLLRNGSRLVTLSGPGGTGKTRLAVEVATELVPDFPAGVFWIGLAALRDASLVTETIAQTLGAQDGLAEQIGERELLLLLDNFEQVVDAAPDLGLLLQRCPKLKLLVTSRELLRIGGEVDYPVPPLTEPDAVELFCERARLEPDEAVAELCRRLDDLPLALELAAARTSALSPIQILERLSQRFVLLRGGRDADPRQQTLGAAIDWSHDLLSETEKQLFRRLSVFAGGATLEAAEDVAEADLDTLQSLVEKSLVRFSDERYRMLETIREYANERLAENGAANMLARRHARHFLEVAEAAEPQLWARQTDVWLPRLDSEETNLRAALGWAIARDEAEVAVRLAGSLYPFWEIRGRHGEARVWLSRALALDGAVPANCRAKALVAAGRATGWQGEMRAAIVLLEEAAELCEKLGDPEGVGRCLGVIGHALLFTGNAEQAAVVLDEAVELARKTEEPRSLQRAVYNAAFAAIEQRDFDLACEMFSEALQVAHADNMKVQEAMCLVHLGYTAALAGDYERARGLLNEGVALFTQLGQTTWTQMAFRYQGLLALLSGRITEAEHLLRSSLINGREQAPQWHIAYWIEDLAAVSAAKDEAPRAATLWGATDALFERFELGTLEENRQIRERFKDKGEESLDAGLRADARAQGHAMTLEQAVAYALSEECPSREGSIALNGV